MSLVYTQSHWETSEGYSGGYRRYPFFANRAAYVNSSMAAFKGNKILVAGCGYGYLVDELRANGFTDVWGCDASTFAITKAATEAPTVAARIVLGDVLSTASLNAVKSAAGLVGGQRFRAIITEDLLPCLTAAELPTALANLRAISQNMAHIITCWEGDGDFAVRQPDGSVIHVATGELIRKSGYLWWTRAEWRAQIPVGEPCVATSDYTVF